MTLEIRENVTPESGSTSTGRPAPQGNSILPTPPAQLERANQRNEHHMTNDGLTPGQRIERALDTSPAASGNQADRLVAASYDEKNDAEAAQIEKLGDTMTPHMRMTLGFHNAAKEAAQEVARGDNQ